MPVLDGFQATEEIRKLSMMEQPYIVAVTASASFEKKSYEAGMNAYMIKPVENTELKRVIEMFNNID
jgi:CheY-like chemotaxis protein